MHYNYNFEWLVNRFDNSEILDFLFFWGHTNSSNGEVGKFCFSQWFELPFVVDSVTYRTAEHWMMANKALLFNDFETYNKIINSRSPQEAKELGRLILGFDDQIWSANRFDIVVKGNIHKFNQHPKFAAYLINTKDRVLVEASPVDKIWGIGLAKDAEQIDNPYFWNGENLLGFALMEVRDFLTGFGHFKALNYLIAPPWKAYPKVDSLDMFWRMGLGEGLVMEFSKYYNTIADRDKIILRLTDPEPYQWKSFFEN